MKKIINGKKYDTETAKELCYASSKYSESDLCYWKETLYQKKTGEFFLYGKGGSKSEYAVFCGQDRWSGSDKIIPLSEQGAKAWAEKRLDGDEYEALFGEVEE